jgi:hypothetical protein
MADKPLSTTRRALLGAAASLPVLILTPAAAHPEPAAARALWDCRLARYRRLAAAAKQAAETGWFRAANDRFNREKAAGPEARKAGFRRMDRAEDLYWRRCTDPMQKAAVALTLTPAPDVRALATKLAVIRTHQLHELDCMTRDCFEVLEEDAGRLVCQLGGFGGGAGSPSRMTPTRNIG